MWIEILLETGIAWYVAKYLVFLVAFIFITRKTFNVDISFDMAIKMLKSILVIVILLEFADATIDLLTSNKMNVGTLELVIVIAVSNLIMLIGFIMSPATGIMVAILCPKIQSKIGCWTTLFSWVLLFFIVKKSDVIDECEGNRVVLVFLVIGRWLMLLYLALLEFIIFKGITIIVKQLIYM